MTEKRSFTLLVLGGTSAIALGYVRARVDDLASESRAIKLILMGRSAERLEVEAQHFAALGVETETKVADLSGDVDLPDDWHIDEAFLAYGQLTDQDRVQGENDYLSAQLSVNFNSAAAWLETLARRFERQGHGQCIVVGSVAGDRGRQSNYAYGAAKAGLAVFVQGMQHRFAGASDIRFLLVKPGFVDTPMTDHIEGKGGPLWATPDQVGQHILKAVKRGKLQLYTPWFWAIIMWIIRAVPSFVLHKTKL
ncbi:SDR family NAD(P)-dependent oxidoreductase [Tateyamaria sp. SN3-11]|uniref:SDR family NAD(P)-dependent oxidoreductase n=1 Tax=Tateyamaria sp. SN3-11 TaxID=3092147 RepID=UPI0039E9290B